MVSRGLWSTCALRTRRYSQTDDAVRVRKGLESLEDGHAVVQHPRLHAYITPLSKREIYIALSLSECRANKNQWK